MVLKFPKTAFTNLLNLLIVLASFPFTLKSTEEVIEVFVSIILFTTIFVRMALIKYPNFLNEFVVLLLSSLVMSIFAHKTNLPEATVNKKTELSTLSETKESEKLFDAEFKLTLKQSKELLNYFRQTNKEQGSN